MVAWLPMFLFVILFGLSMDFHVFILGRVREAVDRGMRTEDAVAHGIRATAGTVTSAAVVMVAVFAISSGGWRGCRRCATAMTSPSRFPRGPEAGPPAGGRADAVTGNPDHSSGSLLGFPKPWRRG